MSAPAPIHVTPGHERPFYDRLMREPDALDMLLAHTRQARAAAIADYARHLVRWLNVVANDGRKCAAENRAG
jgi:hypothetical protein